MALLTVKKTGKASEAATFVPEEAAGATSEIVVPTGLELKVESTLTVTSITTTGAAKLTCTKPFSMTGTSAITFSTETTLSVSGTGALRCTGAGGTTQEIKTGGVDLKILNMNGSGTTKYKLLDALTASTEISLKAGLLTTGNFEVVTAKWVFESATAKELILGSSTLKVTGTGAVWSGAVEIPTKGETSTIEFTGETVIWQPTNTTGLNVATFTGKTITFEGAVTANTLNFNLTGEGREVKWLNGGLFTINTSIAKSAGTQKWASTLGGSSFKLSKASGTVSLEGLEIKDSKAEGGATYKDINGADLGGNTGWTFETTGTQSASMII